jgi:hypothetical protein
VDSRKEGMRNIRSGIHDLRHSGTPGHHSLNPIAPITATVVQQHATVYSALPSPSTLAPPSPRPSA